MWKHYVVKDTVEITAELELHCNLIEYFISLLLDRDFQHLFLPKRKYSVCPTENVKKSVWVIRTVLNSSAFI